jgi:hypothetical protein
MSTEKKTSETAYRIERFHLSSDKLCVVMPHPQATTKTALEQGTIVLRFEEWTTEAFRNEVTAYLNRAEFTPLDVSQHAVDYAERCRAAQSAETSKPR